jgi:tripartite-type tricarboxylate transporter receptor subunit TctC
MAPSLAAFMSGNTACAEKNRCLGLTAILSSQYSGVTVSVAWRSSWPALLTRTRMRQCPTRRRHQDRFALQVRIDRSHNRFVAAIDRNIVPLIDLTAAVFSVVNRGCAGPKPTFRSLVAIGTAWCGVGPGSDPVNAVTNIHQDKAADFTEINIRRGRPKLAMMCVDCALPRRFLGISLIVFAVVALAFSQRDAQAATSYPSKAVRIVVPFAAGGVADITARTVAEKLGNKLGQRFYVENQPGAGGIAAARTVISSPTDGHTLALLTNGTAVSVSLFKNLPFDPLKDFEPVSSLGFFDFVLATGAGSPFKTLGDFVAAAKAKPGTLNVGTINIGSTQNLSAELLKTAAGIDFVIVPFRGTPEVLVSLLQGDIALMIDGYSSIKGNLADGKIRALAVSGAVRSDSTPDIPGAREGGVADYDVISWNALFAPAGTPPEIVKTLNDALHEILADPDVKNRLLELGIEARAGTPSEIGARLKSDIDKWQQVIEKAGIQKQ